MIPVQVKRFSRNPIITPLMLGPDGDNINGPCLVCAPGWLRTPLGRYYLYFAHHRGQYIRLAFADRLEGPWRIHPEGALRLLQTPCGRHIASPDVHVDQEKREFLLYFHGDTPAGQSTFLARSGDGLHFTTITGALGPYYFRVFWHEGSVYALGKGERGMLLLHSDSPQGPFEPGPQILPSARHAGVLKDGDRLWVFFSRTGDTPERIFVTAMHLAGDWRRWHTTDCIPVLGPEEDCEGARQPDLPSMPGAAWGAVKQLRDPFPYREKGRLILLYALAGEQGIGAADLSGYTEGEGA